MRKFLKSTTALAFPRPFENDGPKWKTSDDGAIALQDGKPVYINAEGKETTFDLASIPRTNAENRALRTRAETAETSLKAFEGIDAEAARNALEKVQQLDDKTLIDAGEVEKVRTRINGEWQKKFDGVENDNKSLRSQMQNLVIDNAFANSDFVRDKLAIPSDMAKAAFSQYFEYDQKNNTLVAKKLNGDAILNAQGNAATFEEAIDLIVSEYPHRDRILKGSDQSGGGGAGGNGGRGGSRVMRRSEFAKLSPMDQAARAAEARKGELQIVD